MASCSLNFIFLFGNTISLVSEQGKLHIVISSHTVYPSQSRAKKE